MHIQIEKFGQDHWATFLYAESCAVDNGGVLDNTQMRTRKYEGENHPTRLNDGTPVQDQYHDDWSCMEDLQYAGLLERPDYETFGARTLIRLTDYGWQVAGQLRRWKAEGNTVGAYVAPPRS